MAINISNTTIFNNGIVVSDSRDLYAEILSANVVTNSSPTITGSSNYQSNGTIVITSEEKANFRYVFYDTGLQRKGDHLGGLNFGYHTAGFAGSPATIRNNITRYPFAATTTNAADTADLTLGRGSRPAGQSSTTHGYTSGGIITSPDPTATTNVIDRFPFSSSTTNAADVGDLSGAARYGISGQSSFTHGYNSGGRAGTSPTPGVYYNIIDRFPFAVATTNATDVGDLIIANFTGTSQQY